VALLVSLPLSGGFFLGPALSFSHVRPCSVFSFCALGLFCVGLTWSRLLVVCVKLSGQETQLILMTIMIYVKFYFSLCSQSRASCVSIILTNIVRLNSNFHNWRIWFIVGKLRIFINITEKVYSNYVGQGFERAKNTTLLTMFYWTLPLLSPYSNRSSFSKCISRFSQL